MEVNIFKYYFNINAMWIDCMSDKIDFKENPVYWLINEKVLSSIDDIKKEPIKILEQFEASDSNRISFS